MSDIRNPEKTKCKCCGINKVSLELMHKIERAESISGFEYKLNCVCRCESHNKEEGGVKDSAHLTDEFEQECEAADIEVKNNWYRYHILKGLFLAGFTRLIIYKTFIHADIDKDKPQEITVLD